MTVDILGTEYTIYYANRSEDLSLIDGDIGGYCDHSTKSIIVDENLVDMGRFSCENTFEVLRKVFTHEIVHAFLLESGLAAYSDNEILVDWIAAQFPKLRDVIDDVEAILEDDELR